MFFGCDYVKEETNETSLKGENITTQYIENHISNMDKSIQEKYKHIEVFSINIKSPKSKEIENRIISDLRNFNEEENNVNGSSKVDPEQFPDPNMEDEIIIINSETGTEQLAIPLDNNVETINEYSYGEYNSDIML